MVSSRAVRRAAAVGAVLGVVAGAVLASATGAGAAVLLQCEGTNATSFSPGLLLAEQEVRLTYAESLGPCLVSSDPAVRSGSAAASFPVLAGCLHLDPGVAGSKTFTWNTGETSRFEFTIVGTTVAGQVVVTNTGTITAGKFAGAVAEEVIANASLSLLNCLAPPGVEAVGGTLRLLIAG